MTNPPFESQADLDEWFALAPAIPEQDRPESGLITRIWFLYLSIAPNDPPDLSLAKKLSTIFRREVLNFSDESSLLFRAERWWWRGASCHRYADFEEELLLPGR